MDYINGQSRNRQQDAAFLLRSSLYVSCVFLPTVSCFIISKLPIISEISLIAPSLQALLKIP